MRKFFLTIILFTIGFVSVGQTPMRMLTKKFTLGYDADAQAFFDATGITDATQKSAVNQLVIDLKAASIWTKYKAIYPMVGGTEALHKWNLKDPQDTDAAFRLVFSGTWSHTSSGADPNGSTAYANTFLIPNTSLTLNSQGLQYYSTDNVAVAAYDMGSGAAAGNTKTDIIIKHTNNNSYASFGNLDVSFGNIVADTRGLFTACRTTSTAMAWYKNGTSLATNATASEAISTTAIYLASFNNNGATSTFSSHNCAFAAISDGLTSGEVSSAYTAIQAFQTTLSRQQ